MTPVLCCSRVWSSVKSRVPATEFSFILDFVRVQFPKRKSQHLERKVGLERSGLALRKRHAKINPGTNTRLTCP